MVDHHRVIDGGLCALETALAGAPGHEEDSEIQPVDRAITIEVRAAFCARAPGYEEYPQVKTVDHAVVVEVGGALRALLGEGVATTIEEVAEDLIWCVATQRGIKERHTAVAVPYATATFECCVVSELAVEDARVAQRTLVVDRATLFGSGILQEGAVVEHRLGFVVGDRATILGHVSTEEAVAQHDRATDVVNTVEDGTALACRDVVVKTGSSDGWIAAVPVANRATASVR